jgi:hypothetical protein
LVAAEPMVLLHASPGLGSKNAHQPGFFLMSFRVETTAARILYTLRALRANSSLRREVVHGDGILEQGVVAGDDDDAGFGHEVALAVGFGVVADSGALGEMNVAVDNGAADAAVASDADVSEEDAGVNF